jgi:molecular chaperone HscB
MNNNDHFSLFGLTPRFALDPGALESAYRTVQAQVHPDRFATAGPAERRVAGEWAARANEAVRVLRSPSRRAAYLCELHGAPIDSESNTAMPAGFLDQQLEWREALDDARAADDAPALAELERQAAAERGKLIDELTRLLDERADYPAATAAVRRLMFVEKFGAEVGTATVALAERDQA